MVLVRRHVRTERNDEVVVAARPAENVNDKLPTGEIELQQCQVEVLSVAEPPPFPISERADTVAENTRLQYRYLDIRRDRMQRNIRIRAAVNSAIRTAMAMFATRSRRGGRSPTRCASR